MSNIYVPDLPKPTRREVIIWPNKVLELKSAPVLTFDDKLRTLVSDMFLTMKTNNGVGLSAIQVGVPQRVITLSVPIESLVDKGPDDTSHPEYESLGTDDYVFINPVIVETGNMAMRWDEGCLSVPGYFEERKRPSEIRLKYQDLRGEDQFAEFSGLYAFAIQHEIDHLNGKVFIDELSPLKKDRIKKKIRKTLQRKS